ncbi:hypothetical protein, partial [Deinococcus piscis]|uniref:hypothetical protein n=1 Tax=Deinococcus piscis TaxID=394230 RepID=UPI001E5C25E9
KGSWWSQLGNCNMMQSTPGSYLVVQALTQAEQAGKGKKRAGAMEKLRQIGERLPDTETFLKQRREDSRDDH